jgi:coenzyme F420-reducing hydrogenase gamma subunit
VSAKPRVAFFDFACCEGCQLTVLSIGEPLIEVLKHVDIVSWREAMSERSDEFDIAFVEGSINRESDVPRLKRIREKAKLVVALGSWSLQTYSSWHMARRPGTTRPVRCGPSALRSRWICRSTGAR